MSGRVVGRSGGNGQRLMLAPSVNLIQPSRPATARGFSEFGSGEFYSKDVWQEGVVDEVLFGSSSDGMEETNQVLQSRVTCSRSKFSAPVKIFAREQAVEPRSKAFGSYFWALTGKDSSEEGEEAGVEEKEEGVGVLDQDEDEFVHKVLAEGFSVDEML
ncbi:hypothetical protein E2562_031643 [Oryza meyeriana var. granulata]|uniref:Uncharacterized protein n=1 Tax=Oryza meyeriana var. granulata TaxID=110450 RepID=A0A6G1D9P4_9ORYZ|nr:hypothetical protein E2562_031643 [Oryza meyeriana var. granulata]